jgi:hypothetical protein
LNIILIWIFYEILRTLPQMITIFVLSFYLIDLLLPNRRKYANVIGAFITEIIEHIGVPVIVFLTSLTIPVLHAPLIFGTLYILFGRILGKAETKKDFHKIMALCCLEYFLIMWLADGLMMIGLFFNIWYIVTCPVIIILSTIGWLILRKKIKKSIS